MLLGLVDGLLDLGDLVLAVLQLGVGGSVRLLQLLHALEQGQLVLIDDLLRCLVILKDLIVIRGGQLVLHGLLPLVLLLIELHLDGVDVPLRSIALHCELFDRRLDGLELDSVVPDTLLESLALCLLLELQESRLLVDGLSLLRPILVSCGIQESLLVVEVWLAHAFCIWCVCLGLCNLGFFLFGQLNLVHWLRISWCNTKAELSLVLDFSNTIIVSSIPSFKSGFI